MHLSLKSDRSAQVESSKNALFSDNFREYFYPRTMVLQLGSVRVSVRFELVGETVATARPRSE